MKKFFAFVIAISLSLPAFANEGMWIPLLLTENYEEMQRLGLKLTPEQLYSVNNSSLKDAIVSFGGFCTGEIISDKGLILTNHHCGYGNIQALSTVEDDILTNGFWAKSHSEEKPAEGLFVRFLVRIEDVSERVKKELNAEMSEEQRATKIAEISKEITDESDDEEKSISSRVASFYHGNQFYLFVYETFSDVRLVGTPPESVGKFGGDKDNWEWPRHTGDFSMFRVYSAPDGSPADYSEENIPMKPKHFLPISVDGVKDGDFTMIFGFPGSTDRYLSSYGVRQAIEKYNPAVVKIRTEKLDIMDKYMSADPKTRLQYASKKARVANYWKYYIGQTEQLKNNNVFAKKKSIEDEFQRWATANPERKEKYAPALNLLDESYRESDDYVESKVYVLEAGLLGSDLALFGFRFDRLMRGLNSIKEQREKEMDEAETEEDEKAVAEKYDGQMQSLMANINETVEEHFKNYNQDLDKELFQHLFEMYDADVPASQQPEFFQMVNDKYKGNWCKFTNKVYDKSILADSASVMEFIEDPKMKTLDKDLGVMVGTQLYDMYRGSATAHAETEAKQEKGYRLFTAGLMEMYPNKTFSPDANSTMRMTYGTVGSYDPRDAVFYEYYTTHEGILQKENPDDREFLAPEKLLTLLEKENFGRYANENGDLPVCFISNNDITGGNSGSPVINGKGELIGCAFDGNWEAMSGDIFFEENLQRTISVDARYILYIVDKLAGAQNIIDEIKIVDTPDAPAQGVPAGEGEDAQMDTRKAMR